MNPLIFIKFASVSFQKQITYRFDYFMGILNGFLFVFIFTSLWKSLYSNTGEAAINGFTLSTITSYAVFAMVIRISFTMDDGVIGRKVRTGAVAIDLIRPISFFYMNLAECVGYSMFHFFARGIPILGISVMLYKIPVPNINAIIIFFFSALLGYLILFMINYIIGMLAFWFVEIFPFLLFKYSMITVFSGGIVPIDFFPEDIRSIISILPFQYILYVPTTLLTGHTTSLSVGELIFGQIIWIFILALLCRSLWIVGRNKLMLQGG